MLYHNAIIFRSSCICKKDTWIVNQNVFDLLLYHQILDHIQMHNCSMCPILFHSGFRHDQRHSGRLSKEQKGVPGEWDKFTKKKKAWSFLHQLKCFPPDRTRWEWRPTRTVRWWFPPPECFRHPVWSSGSNTRAAGNTAQTLFKASKSLKFCTKTEWFGNTHSVRQHWGDFLLTSPFKSLKTFRLSCTCSTAWCCYFFPEYKSNV